MESVEVNGVELEYEATGSGEPLLLISPVLADGFVPLLSEPALTDRYQLIRYHKRGWAGRSLWVEVAEFLRSSLPQVEELTVDGVGHLLHIQSPEPVARGMAEFLERNAMADRLDRPRPPVARAGRH